MICPGLSEKHKNFNSQQEKPICPDRKNQFRQNTKKIANPQMKINARKSFVAHDIGQNKFEITLT